MISQLAPTMATVSWQIQKGRGMTIVLVYNIQCSTLVTTYSMKYVTLLAIVTPLYNAIKWFIKVLHKKQFSMDKLSLVLIICEFESCH